MKLYWTALVKQAKILKEKCKMKQNHPSKHSTSQELVLNENGQMKKCLLKNIYENQVRRFAGWGLLSSSLRQSLHSRQDHRALSFLWPQLKVFSREEGGFAGSQLPAQHLPWTWSPGSVRCEWGLFPFSPIYGGLYRLCLVWNPGSLFSSFLK